MFLNEEKKKLMDCTDAEIAAIVRATCTGEVQRYFGDPDQPDYPGGWIEGAIVRSVSATGVYRVKPRPMRINWDHVGEEWNHIRANGNGGVHCYRVPPELLGNWWHPRGNRMLPIHAELFASFQRGDLPWYEATCDRPGHEVNDVSK